MKCALSVLLLLGAAVAVADDTAPETFPGGKWTFDGSNGPGMVMKITLSFTPVKGKKDQFSVTGTFEDSVDARGPVKYTLSGTVTFDPKVQVDGRQKYQRLTGDLKSTEVRRGDRSKHSFKGEYRFLPQELGSLGKESVIAPWSEKFSYALTRDAKLK